MVRQWTAIFILAFLTYGEQALGMEKKRPLPPGPNKSATTIPEHIKKTPPPAPPTAAESKLRKGPPPSPPVSARSALFKGPPPAAPVAPVEESQKSPLLFLSVDGAAVRGYAQFIILKAIPEHVKAELQRRGNEHHIDINNLDITKIFDYAAGTSAGSVNVAGLFTPKDPHLSNTAGHSPMAPKYTLDELKDLTPAILDAAFSTNLLRKIRTLGGLLGTKFTVKQFEPFLEEVMGKDTRVSDTVKPLFITSYDARARKFWLFSTTDACRLREKGKEVFLQKPASDNLQWNEDNILLWEAVRASSAAPVFYKAYEKELGGKKQALIDAGLFVMSPTLQVYTNLQELHPGRPMVILSISSGTPLTEREYKTSGKTAGSIPRVLKSTIEIAIEGQQQQTDHAMKLLPGVKYSRLSFMVENSEFDDVSEKNIQALEKSAQNTVQSEEFRRAVNLIVNALIERDHKKDLPPFICAEKERLIHRSQEPRKPGEEEAAARIIELQREHRRKKECEQLLQEGKLKEYGKLRCSG